MKKIIDLSDRHNMFYWQTNRKLSPEDYKKIFMERHDKIAEKTYRQIVESGMKTAGYNGNDLQIDNIDSIIKRGSVNSVTPIKLKSGKTIVLRIHPMSVKNGYFWVEKTATNMAKKAGVPTYETIHIDDSQKVVPFDFMIMTPVIGQPMANYQSFPPELEKKLVTETGRYAAVINSLKTKGFGFFNNKLAKTKSILQGQYNSFSEHIYAALQEDLKFLIDKQVFSSIQGKKMENLFAKNNSLFNYDRGSLIHNDIADWNEMSDGKSITGIMDWDECFSGDPMMEIAAYNLFFGEPRMTWFKAGYEQISKLEKNIDKFQLFKLRYLISKMHLRTKRSNVDPSPTLKMAITRGYAAMQEVFAYFKV